MATLKGITKQTNNKFLNMYTLHYYNEKTGKDFDYYVASRKDEENLTAKIKEIKCDAVMMFPIFPNGDIVLIKQFRPAINDYIYESPAGLIDPGETIEEALKREMFEETGLTVVEHMELVKPSFTSEGMSDETIAIYACLVNGEISLENKEENEDIEVIVLKRCDIDKFLEENNVSIKTALIIKALK